MKYCMLFLVLYLYPASARLFDVKVREIDLIDQLTSKCFQQVECFIKDKIDERIKVIGNLTDTLSDPDQIHFINVTKSYLSTLKNTLHNPLSDQASLSSQFWLKGPIFKQYGIIAKSMDEQFPQFNSFVTPNSLLEQLSSEDLDKTVLATIDVLESYKTDIHSLYKCLIPKVKGFHLGLAFTLSIVLEEFAKLSDELKGFSALIDKNHQKEVIANSYAKLYAANTQTKTMGLLLEKLDFLVHSLRDGVNFNY